MNIIKLAFVGALLVGSGSAYAGQGHAPALNAPVTATTSIQRLAMRRAVEAHPQNLTSAPRATAPRRFDAPSMADDEPIEHATSFGD